MQTEIVLEDCPHCGGEAKFAAWPIGLICLILFFVPAVW